MLVKFNFIGGVFYVVPRLMALAIRAAANWRRWVAERQLVMNKCGQEKNDSSCRG